MYNKIGIREGGEKMHEELNKEVMFSNISFLVERQGKKIGELEAEAGVSTGYISRTNKDGGTKPGIDFIINVANSLKVSVDTLINVDMSGLTPTELYLISFFEKLKKDTVADKLEWDKESADYLNNMECDGNGFVDHPMFSLETFYQQGGSEYPDEVTRPIMTSYSYDTSTVIAGDCFNLNMKNGTKLYIMNISKDLIKSNDTDAYAKEMWMYGPNVGKQFLSSNHKKSELAVLVDDLYQTVAEFSKHPKIKTEIRSVIDAYINNNDLSSYEMLDDDIPF